MTSLSSNIFPFPSLDHTSLGSPPPTLDRSGLHAPVIGRYQRPTAEDQCEYVALIVRAAIRFRRRNGRGFSSLPPQLRKWLTDLCDAGDPACLVVRDWLNGNRRYVEQTAGRGENELLFPDGDAREGV